MRDLNNIKSKNILKIEKEKAELSFDDTISFVFNIFAMLVEKFNDFFCVAFVNKTFLIFFDNQWDLNVILMCYSSENISFI